MPLQNKRKIYERACMCMLTVTLLGKELVSLSEVLGKDLTEEQVKIVELYYTLEKIAEEYNAEH